MKARQDLVRELREKFIEAVELDDENAELFELEMQAAQEALEKAKASLERKEQALGLEDVGELEKLATSEYMRLRQNARRLKLRLLYRLRARKFELDIVERTHRLLVTGEVSRINSIRRAENH